MTSATSRKSSPLFSLGNLYMTPGAIETVTQHGINVSELLRRHVTGDWGDLDAEDKQANNDALHCGARIFSAYEVAQNEKLWVITEADRASTTVLRPDEY